MIMNDFIVYTTERRSTDFQMRTELDPEEMEEENGKLYQSIRS